MILIAESNFMRSKRPEECSYQRWEILGWIFLIVGWVRVSALVFTHWLFTDITYDSIHSSNNTILKSESHWTGFKFIQPTSMVEFCKETDMENHFGQDDTITDDNDQSHNWSNQDQTRPCSFNNILKRFIQWYCFFGPPDWFDNIITDQRHFWDD